MQADQTSSASGGSQQQQQTLTNTPRQHFETVRLSQRTSNVFGKNASIRRKAQATWRSTFRSSCSSTNSSGRVVCSNVESPPPNASAENRAFFDATSAAGATAPSWLAKRNDSSIHRLFRSLRLRQGSLTMTPYDEYTLLGFSARCRQPCKKQSKRSLTLAVRAVLLREPVEGRERPVDVCFCGN